MVVYIHFLETVRGAVVSLLGPGRFKLLKSLKNDSDLENVSSSTPCPLVWVGQVWELSGGRKPNPRANDNPACI